MRSFLPRKMNTCNSRNKSRAPRINISHITNKNQKSFFVVFVPEIGWLGNVFNARGALRQGALGFMESCFRKGGLIFGGPACEAGWAFGWPRPSHPPAAPPLATGRPRRSPGPPGPPGGGRRRSPPRAGRAGPGRPPQRNRRSRPPAGPGSTCPSGPALASPAMAPAAPDHPSSADPSPSSDPLPPCPGLHQPIPTVCPGFC